MQSNNNVSPEAIVLFGVIAIIFFIIKVVIFIALSIGILLAGFGTVLALCAWNKPIEFDDTVITPKEARAFIFGGIGAAGGAILILCVANGLGLEISQDIIPWTGVVGYIAGSFGALYDLEQEAKKARAEAERAAGQQILLPPAPPPPLPPHQPTFAEWNDEEEWG